MKKVMRKQESGIPWMYLGLDLLGAYILTMVVLLILAWLLYRFRLSPGVINAGIIFTYVLTCFLAGNLAGRQMEKKRFLWGLIMGIAYFAVLLIISSVAGGGLGQIDDTMFTTMLLCVGGGMLGGMLS